jgi:hypothetical protein
MRIRPLLIPPRRGAKPTAVKGYSSRRLSDRHAAAADASARYPACGPSQISMELPDGDGDWLAPSPSPSGPAVPDRHDEHGVDTFIWPPVDTSTWPPVDTFPWPWTNDSSRITAIGRSGIALERLGVGVALSHREIGIRPSRRRLIRLSDSLDRLQHGAEQDETTDCKQDDSGLAVRRFRHRRHSTEVRRPRRVARR